MKRKQNIPIRKMKIFQLERREIFQLEEWKYVFQLEKGKHSNHKKEINPIRKYSN